MLIKNHRATRDDVYVQTPTSVYLAESDSVPYYTGEYAIGLNLFSLHFNLMAAIDSTKDEAPALDLLEALGAAKDMGFDAVDITSYYIPGYDGNLPMRDRLPGQMPTHAVLEHAQRIKEVCQDLELAISGTGIRNDFAAMKAEDRAFDIAITKKWIDVAAAMGAPVMRVFSGLVPGDIDEFGWETITRNRIVPALRECAEYGATKGVKVGVQNHGDMLCTADQMIRTLRWVDHPNVGAVNDTGYFRPFNATDSGDYRWMDDIEAVTPMSVNFQIKRRQAGANSAPMDLDELFTRIRSRGYRGVVPIEFVWDATDPAHPNRLNQPPYDQVIDYLAKVRATSESTAAASPTRPPL